LSHELKACSGCGPGRHAHGMGPSSFWLHDPEVLFGELKLKEGDFFLDLGCGPGDYTMEASRIVGESGVVYALDRDERMISGLTERAASQKVNNIKALVADITGRLPIQSSCLDVCFLATVLHIINIREKERNLFNEIYRVLKKSGRLAIIECKKEDQPWGPPKHIRLCPEEIEESINRYGFEKLSLFDLGHTYMIQFIIK